MLYCITRYAVSLNSGSLPCESPVQLTTPGYHHSVTVDTVGLNKNYYQEVWLLWYVFHRRTIALWQSTRMRVLVPQWLSGLLNLSCCLLSCCSPSGLDQVCQSEGFTSPNHYCIASNFFTWCKVFTNARKEPQKFQPTVFMLIKHMI